MLTRIWEVHEALSKSRLTFSGVGLCFLRVNNKVESFVNTLTELLSNVSLTFVSLNVPLYDIISTTLAFPAQYDLMWQEWIERHDKKTRLEGAANEVNLVEGKKPAGC